MEKIKEDLVGLFDEMLTCLGSFKRKTYDKLFEEKFQEHKHILYDIARVCSEGSEEEQMQIIEELADVIPEHIYKKVKNISRFKRNRESMDYNMNMVAYVIPILTYTGEKHCQKLAERMVALWNAKKINSLKLSVSSYEVISEGFKTSGIGIFGRK